MLVGHDLATSNAIVIDNKPTLGDPNIKVGKMASLLILRFSWPKEIKLGDFARGRKKFVILDHHHSELDLCEKCLLIVFLANDLFP